MACFAYSRDGNNLCSTMYTSKRIKQNEENCNETPTVFLNNKIQLKPGNKQRASL